MVKESTVEFGTKNEKLVQKKLWQYGYKVKHFGGAKYNSGFDLLVENTFKLEVKSRTFKNFSFHFIGEPCDKDCIAYAWAFVFCYPDGTKQIRYAKTSELCEYLRNNPNSNKKLLPPGATMAQRILLANPNVAPLHKSPFKVFGKPKKVERVGNPQKMRNNANLEAIRSN